MIDKGNLYVIAAPSGTGKTTLVKALIDSMPKITVSVSHTTRPKRSNETHGINYYFVDKAEFARMIANEDFFEHAIIFNHHYGTSKRWVEDTLAKGIDVILEIDWQGHQQIKRLFLHAIGIFILPPSLADIENRLIKRNQDHPEIIKQRLTDAKETIAHINEFEYVVVNDDFDQALADLTIIVKSGRLLKNRQVIKFENLINDLKKIHI